MILVFILLTSLLAYSSEGYPPEIVTIRMENGMAVIKNPACFPVTVFVNDKDYFVAANSQVPLEKKTWTKWSWLPGSTGKMDKRIVLSPLAQALTPSYGPDSGFSHSGNRRFSYDFSVPEGTAVVAMENGIVFRIVEKYHLAHQDKNRMNEVNKVEVIHPDGSTATYVHLMANSVKVKLCESIQAGQLIARSGHNGYSAGPHLHVDVIRPTGKGNYHTIPLSFKSK